MVTQTHVRHTFIFAAFVEAGYFMEVRVLCTFLGVETKTFRGKEQLLKKQTSKIYTDLIFVHIIIRACTNQGKCETSPGD